MSMSLRRRILLTVLPFLLLLAGLGGTGTLLMLRLGQQTDAILRENYDSVVAMAQLNEAAERIDSAQLFALAGQENPSREIYRDNDGNPL